MLLTPAGLSPGDTFRFIFVTDGSITGTSSSIADYNNFVNAQAGGATYDGRVVTWDAIASTPTVNAIDNVGQAQDPVYLADGTKVTTSTTSSGLWSGTLLHVPDEDLTGKIQQVLLWTGTNSDGTGATDRIGDQLQLGSSIQTAILGDTVSIAGWVHIEALGTDLSNPLYGISAELTVPQQSAVPEPASLWLLGTAISAGLAYGWSRRRRN